MRYSALPIIIGVVVSLAPDMRLYRSFFLDEINQDYVRTARAKGMSEARVMWVHVLRNAAIPIITNVMIQLPGPARRRVSDRAFLLDPRDRPRGDPRGRAQRFPGDQGGDGLRRDRDHGHQSAADLMYKAVDPRVQLK